MLNTIPLSIINYFALVSLDLVVNFFKYALENYLNNIEQYDE